MKRLLWVAAAVVLAATVITPQFATAIVVAANVEMGDTQVSWAPDIGAPCKSRVAATRYIPTGVFNFAKAFTLTFSLTRGSLHRA